MEAEKGGTSNGERGLTKPGSRVLPTSSHRHSQPPPFCTLYRGANTSIASEYFNRTWPPYMRPYAYMISLALAKPYSNPAIATGTPIQSSHAFVCHPIYAASCRHSRHRHLRLINASRVLRCANLQKRRGCLHSTIRRIHTRDTPHCRCSGRSTISKCFSLRRLETNHNVEVSQFVIVSGVSWLVVFQPNTLLPTCLLSRAEAFQKLITSDIVIMDSY
jgi:hypothetical protein